MQLNEDNVGCTSNDINGIQVFSCLTPRPVNLDEQSTGQCESINECCEENTLSMPYDINRNIQFVFNIPCTPKLPVTNVPCNDQFTFVNETCDVNRSLQFVLKIPSTPKPLNLDSSSDVSSSNSTYPTPRMSLSPKPVSCQNIHSQVSFIFNNDNNQSIKKENIVDGNPSNDLHCTTISLLKTNANKSSSRLSVLKCRICLDYEKGGEKLLSPCRCKGTVGLMHSSCLEQWIQICGKEQCEICKCNYDMRKRKRNCQMWFHHIYREKSFIGDVICLVFLVPCTIIAVYFCIKAALFLLSPGAITAEHQSQWRGMGLIVLSMFLVFCLLVWIMFTIKHYFKHFYIYRSEEFRYSIHDRRRSTIAQTLNRV